MSGDHKSLATLAEERYSADARRSGAATRAVTGNAAAEQWQIEMDFADADENYCAVARRFGRAAQRFIDG